MGLKFVDRVFSTKTLEGQREIYDEWSASYEQEVFGNGYRTPAIIAATFTRFIPQNIGPILDAGCGGGLQSEPLALLGYRPLIGLDISAGMLSVASAKGIYDELIEGPVASDMPFSDGKFGAVISAGALSPGQAPASSLSELARVTRPGGFCVFSLRGGEKTSPDYIEACDKLSAQGKWSLRFASGDYKVMPIAEPEGIHEVRAYEILI
ncbi:MAG: class I SAM-dependent DNA methyltransferase [Alphaproteobacteria bacterium]